MGNRHKAREFALQLLYAVDVCETPLPAMAPLFWETLTCPEEVRRFANQLAAGVYEELPLIDRAVAMFSEHWTIDRMTAVDRNILRMSVYELLFLRDIPHSVTINEAVELGKKFGSEDSGAFVNGILDRVAKEADVGVIERLRAGEATDKDAAQVRAAAAPMPMIIPDPGPAILLPRANGADAEGAIDLVESEAHRQRREVMMKAGRDRKMPVGSRITIRKGDRV